MALAMSATATLSAEDAPVWVSHYRDGGSSALPKLEDGKTVRNLKVFKVGTFRDSRGIQRTYTADDLTKLVTHFNQLRDQNVLVDVPVRADHSESVRQVEGYFTALRSDDKFLYADFEFTEPDGAARYERGTYRQRSIEIGPYETNGEKPDKFFPVVTGLAFVDIGAVQGLYRTGTNNPEDIPVEQHTFRIRGVNTTDYAAVETYIAELEAAAAKGPVLHKFRMNGGEVTDYAAVQAQLESHEKFRAEALDAGRAAFVAKLVDDNKLAAPSKDGTTNFVKTLSSEQFAAWKSTWDNAPTIGTFQQHSGSGNPAGNGNGASNPKAEEIELLEATVQMHRDSNMPQDQLEKTESYQRLAKLTA